MDIFELLQLKLADERKTLVDNLAYGRCADHAEYKFLCGQLRGLNLADEIIRDLAKRSKEDADE